MDQAQAFDELATRTPLPSPAMQRWLDPVVRFLHVESASGIFLLCVTAVALFLANSPWAHQYHEFWHLPVQLTFGPWTLRESLLHVVNDGLMVVFFFVVGLEIKREIVAGELRDVRQAALPIVAALGGMIAPAGLYLGLARVLNLEPAAIRGWAIPMATDIAFVVGVMALFGRRVPFGLKILLLTLAIVDDLGAVLIIAFVYTGDLAWGLLGWAAAGCGLVAVLNRLGVRAIGVYVFIGIGIWLAVFSSGIHPTIAGVVLGLMTPARPWVAPLPLAGELIRLLELLRSTPEEEQPLQNALSRTEFAAREALSPLERLESALHPWVAFGIMPVFALANAGIAIQPAALGDPLALCVAAGLALGKPTGILAACGLAVAVGLARLPRGVSWGLLAGGGCLGGIGFTMSLFLTGLALPESLQEAGKLGTLLGSAISSVAGGLVILLAGRRTAIDTPEEIQRELPFTE